MNNDRQSKTKPEVHFLELLEILNLRIQDTSADMKLNKEKSFWLPQFRYVMIATTSFLLINLSRFN